MTVQFDVNQAGLTSLRARVVVPWARQRAEAVALCAVEAAPIDTGELVESIDVQGPFDTTGPRARWDVVVLADHALYVEFGTRYMAAQPYLRPCLSRAIP